MRVRSFDCVKGLIGTVKIVYCIVLLLQIEDLSFLQTAFRNMIFFPHHLFFYRQLVSEPQRKLVSIVRAAFKLLIFPLFYNVFYCCTVEQVNFDYKWLILFYRSSQVCITFELNFHVNQSQKTFAQIKNLCGKSSSFLPD